MEYNLSALSGSSNHLRWLTVTRNSVICKIWKRFYPLFWVKVSKKEKGINNHLPVHYAQHTSPPTSSKFTPRICDDFRKHFKVDGKVSSKGTWNKFHHRLFFMLHLNLSEKHRSFDKYTCLNNSFARSFVINSFFF